VLAAQSLLAGSPLPLKAIAAQAGFASPSQFSRQFLRTTGSTPSAFRARTRASVAASVRTGTARQK
jgi:AraC family transcriptional regulator